MMVVREEMRFGRVSRLGQEEAAVSPWPTLRISDHQDWSSRSDKTVLLDG